MWFTQHLLPALLLLGGLGPDAGHARTISDLALVGDLTPRGDAWSELPKNGKKATKQQMDNVAKVAELNGMCLFYRGAGDRSRGIGLCEKQCQKDPGRGKKEKARIEAVERVFVARQNGEKPDFSDKMGAMGAGVSCYGNVEPNGRAQTYVDENGHQWISGRCECSSPAAMKAIVAFVGDGLDELGKMIVNALQDICAFGFGMLRDVTDWGISFVPGVGVAVRGVKISAKVVKAAKAAYKHGAEQEDFYNGFVKSVCGKPPPFDLSPDGLFMTLVNLPESALGNEKDIGCKLAKGKACKKIEAMAEPKDPKKEIKIWEPKKKGKKTGKTTGKNKKPRSPKEKSNDKKKGKPKSNENKEQEEKAKKEKEEKARLAKEAEEKKKNEEEKKKGKPVGKGKGQGKGQGKGKGKGKGKGTTNACPADKDYMGF
ncbi:glycosyl hydrolase family 18 [Apiospora arundinis]|uniref:Glycosyl hydrolase family 18 n=1 Tax=Apiospora arundinis TaxID=335852 RepID=A0ABR2IAH7_9PEZI